MSTITVVRDEELNAPTATQYTGLKLEGTVFGGASYLAGGTADDFATLKPGATATKREGGNCLNGTHYVRYNDTTGKWLIFINATDVQLADAVDASVAAFGAPVVVTFNR